MGTKTPLQWRTSFRSHAAPPLTVHPLLARQQPHLLAPRHRDHMDYTQEHSRSEHVVRTWAPLYSRRGQACRGTCVLVWPAKYLCELRLGLIGPPPPCEARGQSRRAAHEAAAGRGGGSCVLVKPSGAALATSAEVKHAVWGPRAALLWLEIAEGQKSALPVLCVDIVG